jgi:hypothetical protein
MAPPAVASQPPPTKSLGPENCTMTCGADAIVLRPYLLPKLLALGEAVNHLASSSSGATLRASVEREK